MTKPALTIEKLKVEAKHFCEQESVLRNEALYGVTDGKAVGTYVEQKFKTRLAAQYAVEIGNAASGIDLPSADILTDIKVTSIRQPQSSCPFRDSRQKIFGLGYNLLVFVYDKTDDPHSKTATLDFVSCSFVEKERTGDFQTTMMLRQMIENQANEDDIFAYLEDKQIPGDETLLRQIARQVIGTPVAQGYLTISNALQWRLQYNRIVHLQDEINGISRIVHKVTKT